MFNAKQWATAVQSAALARDADTLAILLTSNDPNGVYSYDDFCHEYGDTTRAEWVEHTIECAEQTLEELEENLTPEEWAELTRS